ncbi:MAG TPA: hypothetical protein VIV60_17330 [Polyangiaceae bacterium]
MLLVKTPRYTCSVAWHCLVLPVAVACSSPESSSDAGAMGGNTNTSSMNVAGANQRSGTGGVPNTLADTSAALAGNTMSLSGVAGGSNSSITGGTAGATSAVEDSLGGGVGGRSNVSVTSDTAGAAQGGAAQGGAAQGGAAQGGASPVTAGAAGVAQAGSTSIGNAYWSIIPTAQPLTVAFTTEDTARVIKDMPITGGVIKTQSQDGTTFELTIPNNGLLSPETIAMTPVHLQTQPFGEGPAWGVQLLPDGLTFNAPLKLVITPPAGQIPAVGQQVPFGWSGTSHVVELAYADPAASSLTLQILHFSSYAYATATQGISSSLAGVRNRIGGTAEARIQSAMAERLSAMRQQALLGMPSEGLIGDAEVQALMQQYEAEVVKARVSAAGSSCAAGRLALETLLGYERQRQLLGFEDNSSLSSMADLIDTVSSVCLDEEWGLCRDQHIVQRLIPVYLGMERQAQLLGIDTAGKAWEAKALDYISRCHRYRLDVDSKAGTVCDQWTFSEPVFGQIKLQMDAPPLGNIRGTGELASQSYAIDYTDACSGVTNIVQLSPTFDVQSLGWQLKTDPLTQGKGEIRDFVMPYSPGPAASGSFGSTHVVVDLCGDPPSPPELVPLFNWWSIYAVAMGLNPKYFSETQGWLFTDWTVYNNGGAILARKTVNEPYNDGDITWTAPTSLVITHTPG